jgi:hypothetical protein
MSLVTDHWEADLLINALVETVDAVSSTGRVTVDPESGFELAKSKLLCSGLVNIRVIFNAAQPVCRVYAALSTTPAAACLSHKGGHSCCINSVMVG